MVLSPTLVPYQSPIFVKENPDAKKVFNHHFWEQNNIFPPSRFSTKILHSKTSEQCSFGPPISNKAPVRVIRTDYD